MFDSTKNYSSTPSATLSNSVVLLLMLLLLLLGMNSANSSNPRGRRMVPVRGRTLTRIAPDAAVITVAITVHAGTLIERVQMLRRGRYPLLLMVLLNLPDKVTAVTSLTLAAVPQVNLVGVVVEETLLLLLLLLLKLLLLATAL